MKKLILILLTTTTLSFSQSSIVAGGNKNETFGETFPIMQQVDTIVETTLSVPKFEVPKEIPTEKPKTKPKKTSFFEKLIQFIVSLFK